MSQPLLQIDALTTAYGSARALDGIELHVQPGEAVAIVGANGAGKTTLLRTIAGLLRAQSGRVIFEGREITHLAPHRMAQQGIGQVHEGRQLFPTLTVQENLELGAFSRRRGVALDDDFQLVYATFPRLAERRRQLAGTLSGGEQQMLAIARALMARPRLLLLDEPSMGLAPSIIQSIFGVLADLNRTGLSLLLVEQNARAAFAVTTRGYVLAAGRVVLHGSSRELAQSPDVQRVYLGASAA